MTTYGNTLPAHVAALTPAEAGFRMPPEWALHERCWMAWPCHLDLWGERLPAARRAFAQVARTIARFEPVTMLVCPQEVAEATRLCGPQVHIEVQPLTDSWMRDMGPSFVLGPQGELAGVDWQFNNWGNKEGYPQARIALDDAVAGSVLTRAGARGFEAPLVLEGGSIHVDGEGTVLTTEQCLLNPNRNPHLGREQIEAQLHAHLGTEHVVWLGEGLTDDLTDGHVDNIACFARPGVVVALTCSDPSDSNYAPLQDNLRRLARARDARGRALEVVTLEQPAPRWFADGRRIPLSYVNYYLANGAVIVPTFEDRQRDAAALATLAEVFPEREVVGVAGLDIVVGGGNVHCITQQQPARGLG